MYPQTLQALCFLDAQRLLELQYFHKFMEKHPHECKNDVYEPIRRLAMIEDVRRSPGKPLTSFKIRDILSADNGDPPSTTNPGGKSTHTRQQPSTHHSRNSMFCERISTGCGDHRVNSVRVRHTYHRVPNRTSPPVKNKIIRPWSRSLSLASPSSDEGSEDSSLHSKHHVTAPRLNSPENHSVNTLCKDDEFIDVEHCEEDDDDDADSQSNTETDVSPLDALMAMSSKTFKGLDDFDKHRQGGHDQGKLNVPKKKRKTRTAFTNQQIYELEKRFIMQKYLTPADRDEISAKLGLSCAQVITWFQNRRAKFKRDIEEMKNDVTAGSPDPKDVNDGTLT